MSRRDSSRPRGPQDQLAETLLPLLLDDFAEHAAEAIERVSQANPIAYLRIVAAVIPKHFAIDDDETKHLTDEELDARIAELDAQIAVGRAFKATKP